MIPAPPLPDSEISTTLTPGHVLAPDRRQTPRLLRRLAAMFVLAVAAGAAAGPATRSLYTRFYGNEYFRRDIGLTEQTSPRLFWRRDFASLQPVKQECFRERLGDTRLKFLLDNHGYEPPGIDAIVRECWRTETSKASPTSPIKYAADDYKIIFTSVPVDNSDAGKKSLQPYLDQTLAYLHWLRFPKTLMDGVVVGIISPTFEGGNVTIGNINFQNIPKTTYGPGSTEGITYSTSDAARGIFLPAYTLQTEFYPTLTHELGHVLAKKLTSGDWIEWARLRGAPNTNYSDSVWAIKPEEDFAEAYKAVFGNHQGDSSLWENKTSWGKVDCKLAYPFSQCLIDAPPSAEAISFIRDVLKRYESQ